MDRVMIVAGEASGDLHGAKLVHAVRNLAPGIDFFGVGGENLRRAGTHLISDLERMSLMGITEIVSSLADTYLLLKNLKNRIVKDRPRALVLIDYPDFNFRLARAAKKVGVPVFYYVCPQIWAWRTWRIREMRNLVDRRVVILPFEVDFYRSHGLSADFVGNPLVDEMEPPRPKPLVKEELGLDPDRPLLLLMPGSRRKIVEQILPPMLRAVRMLRGKHPRLVTVLAKADTLSRDFLHSFEVDEARVHIKEGVTHQLQNAADLALVTSGTTTLETAMMLTPMVVVYRVQPLSYLAGLLLIKREIGHVAIPNLVAGERLAPELLQHDVRPERMAHELDKILTRPEVKNHMTEGFARVRTKLGEPGVAQRAARLLLETMDAPSQGKIVHAGF